MAETRVEISDPESEFFASNQETGKEWELYKENERPLKGGRNVNLLKQALKSHTDHHLRKSLIEKRRKLIEDEEYNGNDPLFPWIQCIEWVQEVEHCADAEEPKENNMPSRSFGTVLSRGDNNSEYAGRQALGTQVKKTLRSSDRYWCHMCSQIVDPIINAEIKSPLCQNGFVEEMSGENNVGNRNSNSLTEIQDSEIDFSTDCALTLWGPILLGMTSNHRRRRREFDSIIRRRRRSSAAILQLLQGIREGLTTEDESSENRSQFNRAAYNLIRPLLVLLELEIT
ncbi:unnamed protein product [Eruca vesicaria subsp. sativa]|uniref:RING-type E3 ubiquitin transferase n=1 Tax=Eruca vesicaria subsp. sativa TaxID=29727 RepID=A0ABC8J548_ERUVS|nr:unnamed protein product [Eruca vesicaria subsp. sativa]